MQENTHTSEYKRPEWRFGPLHATNGQVVLGDPLQHHAVLTPSGVTLRDGSMASESFQWDSLSLARLDCPQSSTRAATHLVDAAALVISLFSASVETIEAHDPGQLELTTEAGRAARWDLSTIGTGKYWTKHLNIAQRLMTEAIEDQSRRAILDDPAAVQRWCTKQV